VKSDARPEPALEAEIAALRENVGARRMADTTADRLAYFDFTRPAELCIGCGACTQVCCTDAIHIEERDGMRSTIITGTVVREQPLLSCSECGAPHGDARPPGLHSCSAA
jgi:ferredoxin